MAFTPVKELSEYLRIGSENFYIGCQFRQNAIKTLKLLFYSRLNRKIGKHICVVLIGKTCRTTVKVKISLYSVNDPTFVSLLGPIVGRMINLL